MAKTFKQYERAPHTPHRCVVCAVVPSADNPVLDLDKQIDFYGMVYLCYRCTVNITDQLGFATPDVAKLLRTENAELKERLDRIPAVTERLVNDIRDISINATADLLSSNTVNVLVDDQNNKQSDSGVNSDYLGDDKPAKSNSKPAVRKGPPSVPADNGSSDPTTTDAGTDSSSN